MESAGALLGILGGAERGDCCCERRAGADELGSAGERDAADGYDRDRDLLDRGLQQCEPNYGIGVLLRAGAEDGPEADQICAAALGVVRLRQIVGGDSDLDLAAELTPNVFDRLIGLADVCALRADLSYQPEAVVQHKRHTVVAAQRL